MTRYEELTSGRSNLVTIHVTVDEANDRYRFHSTRTSLERDRKKYGDKMRYKVGVKVPGDSQAAALAVQRWFAEN